jgi:hypothetical protein
VPRRGLVAHRPTFARSYVLHSVSDSTSELAIRAVLTLDFRALSARAAATDIEPLLQLHVALQTSDNWQLPIWKVEPLILNARTGEMPMRKALLQKETGQASFSADVFV